MVMLTTDLYKLILTYIAAEAKCNINTQDRALVLTRPWPCRSCLWPWPWKSSSWPWQSSPWPWRLWSRFHVFQLHRHSTWWIAAWCTICAKLGTILFSYKAHTHTSKYVLVGGVYRVHLRALEPMGHYHLIGGHCNMMIRYLWQKEKWLKQQQETTVHIKPEQSKLFLEQ